MYYPLTLQTLIDVDECSGRNRRRLCQSNAECINKPGTFICECNDGYRMLKNGTCKGT